MGTHSDGYVEQELLTTFVTCEGDLSDPQFNTKFARLLKQLQKLLLKDPGQYLGVVKVEPWNSVRVTFTVPKEAALRLRQLAQQGDATLSQLGILSVQLEGDQAISLRIAGRVGGESREIVLRTSAAPATTSADSGAGSSSSNSGSSGGGGNLSTADATLAAAFDHHLISKSGPASTAGVGASGTTASFIKTMTQVTTAAMSAFKTPAVQSGPSSGLSFGCAMTTPSDSGMPPNKIITTVPMATVSKNTSLPQHSYHSAFVSTSGSSSNAATPHHQTAIVENSHRFSLPPPPYPNSASMKQQSAMANVNSKGAIRTVTSAAVSDDLLTGGLSSTTNASPANVALSSPLLVNLLQNDGVPNSNKIAAASSSSSQDKLRLKQSTSSPHIKTTVVLPSPSSSTTTVARRKETISHPDLLVPDSGGGGEAQQVIQRIQRGATSASSENNLTMVTNVRIPVDCPTVTNPHLSCTSNNNQANATDMAAATASSATGNGKLPTMNHLSTVTANVKQSYTSQSPVVNMFQRQVVATVPAPTSSAAGAIASISKTASAAPTTLINNQLANRITYSHNDNQLVALAGHQSPHPQAKFGVRVINMQQQSPQLQQQQLFHQSQQQQLLQKQLLQQQQQQQISQYQQPQSQHQQFVIGNAGSQQQQHAKSVILQQNVVAAGTPKMGFVGSRMVTLTTPQQQQLQQQQFNELVNDSTLFNTGANDLESVVDMLGAAVAADSTTVSTKLEHIPSNNMVQFVKSFALTASQQHQQQQMMAAKLNATPKLNNTPYGVLSAGLPTGYHNAVVTSTNAAFNQSLGDNQFDSIDGSDLFSPSANGATILTTQPSQQQKMYQNTTLQQHHPTTELQYPTHQHQLPPQYSSRYVVTTTDTSTTKAPITDQMKSIMPLTVSPATVAVQQQPPPPPYSSTSGSSNSGTFSSNNTHGSSSSSGITSTSSSSDREPQFLINPLTGEMEPMPNEGSDNEENDNQTTDIFNSLPPSVTQNDDSCFSFSPPSSAATPVASSVASNEKSSSMLYSDDNDDDSASRMSSPATRRTITTSEDDSNSGSGDIKPSMTYGGDNFVTTGVGRHRIIPSSASATGSGNSGVERSEIKIKLKVSKNEPPLSCTGTYNKKVDKPTSIVKPMPRVSTTAPGSQSSQQPTAINSATADEPRVPPIRLSLRGKNFGFVKKNKKWSDESKEPASTIPVDESILEKKSYFKNKLSPNEIVADDVSVDVCSGGKSPASGTAIVAKLSAVHGDDTEELKVKPTARSRKSSAVVAAAVIVDTPPIDETQAMTSADNSSNEISNSPYVSLPSVRTFPTEAEVTSILRNIPTDAPNKMSLSCVKIKKKEAARKNKMFPRDRSAALTTHTDDSTDTFTRVINETKCTLSSQSARGNKTKSNAPSLLKSVMKSSAAKEARMMNLANRNLEKRQTASGQDNMLAVIGGKAVSAQAHQRRASADMSYSVAITTATTFSNTKTNQRSSASVGSVPTTATASVMSSSSDPSSSSFSGATQQFVPSSSHSANNLYPSSGLNTSNGSINNNSNSGGNGNGNSVISGVKDISNRKFVINNTSLSNPGTVSVPTSMAVPTVTKKIANNCKTMTAAASSRDYQQSLKSGVTTTTTTGPTQSVTMAEIRKEIMVNHDATTTSKKSNFVKKNISATSTVDQLDATKQQQAIVVNCLQVESSSSGITPGTTTAPVTGVTSLPTTHLDLSEKVMKQRLLEDVSSAFGEPQRKKLRLDTNSGSDGAEIIIKNGPVPDRLITTGNNGALSAGPKDSSNGNGATEVVSTGLGGESPSSGANSEHTNNQGEDSGIESMDALSEKSPNQGESPCRKEEKDGHADPSNTTNAANQREKKTSNAYCDKASISDNFGSGSQVNDKIQVADNDISNVPIVTSSCNTTVAGKMITTSSLVLVNCLETSTSSPGIIDAANTADKDDKTSYERDDTMSPDLDDVQPFRVTPALYTYSNPEKMRVDSPSPVLEDIADDISMSPKPVVILEQPKPSPRVKRRRKEVHDPMFVTTEKPKSSPSKSLLEQLLIDIPTDGGVEIRRTGMSTRNTRSQLKGLSQPSPDTLSMCSTSSSSSIKTPKCSPVPRSTDDTPTKPSPRPSSRLTSRRSRKGSESSNVSNGDETVTYGRTSKRKCSDNSSSEITKGCIGFEDQNGKKVAISTTTSIEAFRTSISENNVGGTPTVVVSSTKANVTRSSTGAINKRMNNLVGDVTQSTPTRHAGKKRKGIGDTPVNRKSSYNKSNDNELALIQVTAGSEREELVSEQSVNVTSTTTPRGNNRLSSTANNSAAASSKQTTPATTGRRSSVRQNHITRRRKTTAAADTATDTPIAVSLTNNSSSAVSTPIAANNNNNNNNSNKNNNMKPNASSATGSNVTAAAAANDTCKNVNNDKNGSVNTEKIETKSISKLNCVTKKEITSQMTTSSSSSTTNSIIDTKIAAASTSSTFSSTVAESCATAAGTVNAANATTTNATAAFTNTSATAATTITTSTVTTRGNSVKQTQHLINDSAIAAPPQDISHTHTIPVSEEVINTRRKTRSVANSNVSDELTNKRRRNSRDGK